MIKSIIAPLPNRQIYHTFQTDPVCYWVCHVRWQTVHYLWAQDNHEKENEASIEAQLLMFQVAEAIATSDKDQSYGLPDTSLEHQILREIDIGPPWPLPT